MIRAVGMAENIVRPFLPIHFPAKGPALSAKVDGPLPPGVLFVLVCFHGKIAEHVSLTHGLQLAVVEKPPDVEFR
jgi:hypothetical protein